MAYLARILREPANPAWASFHEAVLFDLETCFSLWLMGPGGDEGGVLAYLWPGVPAQTETLFPQPELDCEVMGRQGRVKKPLFSHTLVLGWGWSGEEEKIRNSI